jgi:hypothetical protein
MEWKEKHNLEIKPEDLNCDGCLSENAGHIYCAIRLCGRERDVVNCAYCEEYICEKLDEHLQWNPVGKNTLAEIRQNL